MKRLILTLLAVVGMTLTAVAQPKEVGVALKKLEKNETAVADAKKAAMASTWIERADIYVDLAVAYTSKLIPGFTIDQVSSMIGAAQGTEEVTLKGTTYTKHNYDNMAIYTTPEGQISFWTVAKDPVDKPLISAFTALKKAKELSAKDFVGSGKGALAVGRLQAQFQSDGMAAYNMDIPAKAAEDFYNSFEAGELAGAFDTTYLYYAGIAFNEAGDYAKSISAMDKVLASGQEEDGTVYFYLAESYAKLDQNDKAIELLEQGMKKYPSNATIVGTLINSYLTAKKDPAKIIEILNEAKKLDDKNVSLYLVESNIYNETGNRVKAYETLEKATTIDPKFFQGYYNFALMKILEAQELREKAEKLDLNDTKGYEELINQVIALQGDAIAKLEKAFEVDPTHFDTADLLKQLYFARKDESSENAAKYAKYEQKSKELSESAKK